MNINNDHWKTLWIDVETHQSSEYVPLSCAAQNLSLCWKRTISISIQQFRGKNKTLGTMEDISIGYYPTFMKYNQKKWETKMQMTAIKLRKKTYASWIELNDSVSACFQLESFWGYRKHLFLLAGPMLRFAYRIVSTLYQLAVYLLGLGILHPHCISTHNVLRRVRKSVLSANKSRLIVCLSVFEGLDRTH